MKTHGWELQLGEWIAQLVICCKRVFQHDACFSDFHFGMDLFIHFCWTEYIVSRVWRYDSPACSCYPKHSLWWVRSYLDPMEICLWQSNNCFALKSWSHKLKAILLAFTHIAHIYFWVISVPLDIWFQDHDHNSIF